MPPSQASRGVGWHMDCEKVSGRAGTEGKAGESWEGCWEGRLWAWESGVPTCDLWGLDHSFLEEGFCFCEGQESLWCSAQTLFTRGSLGGEAILLVCWGRLQAIHQGLLVRQAVDAGTHSGTSQRRTVHAPPQLQPPPTPARTLGLGAGTSTEAPGGPAPLSAQPPSAALRTASLRL